MPFKRSLNGGRQYSAVALTWVESVAVAQGIRIQHAVNGGEVAVEGRQVDGYHHDSGTIYEFHGCFFHGCPRCYPNRTTTNAVSKRTMEELYQATQHRENQLQGYNLVTMWECDFMATVKQQPPLQARLAYWKQQGPLEPRDAFFGGRTNAIRLFYEPSADEEIRYVVFTSLYPYCNKYKKLPVGHPQVLLGEDIPDRVEGLLKCKVLPPKQLFHPVLPARIGGKLKFTLCRTCALQGWQEECRHSDEERALTGTWVSVEIEKAVEMGYTLVEKYEALHYTEVEVYDPATKQGGLWAGYVDKFLKLKQEASGYPEGCETEEAKQKYVDEYYQQEGIQLDPSNIKYNKSLRELSKLMLNSHWGKFGQNPQKSQTVYVDEPKQYVELMTSGDKEVQNLTIVNDTMILLKYKLKEDFVEMLPNTNVVLACYTTAHARLKLYELLEKLEDRVLYMDTDSVVYIHKSDASYNPPLGDYLGELKDETNGIPITSFVSAGPKNYAYRLQDGSSVCKVKGFSLNHRASLQLNFDSMKEIVTTNPTATIEVTAPNALVRKNRDIFTTAQTKTYKLVYDKRRLLEDLTTLPFGWRTEEPSAKRRRLH